MTQKAIKKIEFFIKESEPFIIKINASKKSISSRQSIRSGEYSAYTSSVLQFLGCILDKECPYIQEYKKNALDHNIESIKNGVDVLKRILADINDGWLIDLKGLLTSEIFSNFLEMAEHLLEENYKDPAAVIVGSVLEGHLRNLCLKNGIDLNYIDARGKIITKRAGALNDDLAKNATYNNLEQKSIVAWLDLRNKAAHGKYGEYDYSQVKNLLQNVSDFIRRTPL